jgi:Skp family chaperone for outer membrane proteins
MLATALLVSAAFAQKQKNIIKIGCIDIQRVIDKVASDKLLQKILINNKAEYLRKAEELSTEIRRLKNILATEGDNLSRERAEAYREEIIFKEEQLAMFLEEKSAGIRQLENDIQVEILRSVYEYIKRVSIRKGYSMIVEKGTAVIYVNPDFDITTEVIEELEKQKDPYRVE